MRYTTEQRELIEKAIKERSRDEMDRMTAAKLINRYPVVFQNVPEIILRSYINYVAHKLGRPNHVKSFNKKKHEMKIQELLKLYPEDSIVSLTNKFISSFPFSFSHARQIISQVRKFNKIL